MILVGPVLCVLLKSRFIYYRKKHTRTHLGTLCAYHRASTHSDLQFSYTVPLCCAVVCCSYKPSGDRNHTHFPFIITSSHLRLVHFFVKNGSNELHEACHTLSPLVPGLWLWKSFSPFKNPWHTCSTLHSRPWVICRDTQTSLSAGTFNE